MNTQSHVGAKLDQDSWLQINSQGVSRYICHVELWVKMFDKYSSLPIFDTSVPIFFAPCPFSKIPTIQNAQFEVRHGDNHRMTDYIITWLWWSEYDILYNYMTKIMIITVWQIRREDSVAISRHRGLRAEPNSSSFEVIKWRSTYNDQHITARIKCNFWARVVRGSALGMSPISCFSKLIHALIQNWNQKMDIFLNLILYLY